jgi:DNA-binding NtrC family response regulator
VLIRVVIAGHPQAFRRLRKVLTKSHILVHSLGRPGEDLSLVDREDFDLAILPRERLGERVETILRRLRALPDQPEVLVLVKEEDPEDRARLLSAGCLAVLNETLPDETLRDAVLALARRRREAMESRLSSVMVDSRASLQDFVSESPTMRQFMSLVRKVVDADSSLLLCGETGVGKERLARAIHSESPRSGGPFVAVNCAAVPETLLESELFGHEKGAFTGANRARRGYFELAHRGTVFLDEIGELPFHLQVKLLRVLQDRAIQRVGGESLQPVDIRLMAATNRNLEEAMEEGRFRADLYYRLGVVTLTVPPLRERREDIPALVASYLAHYRVLLGRSVARIRPEALEALVSYAWPGNVREMINAVERAVLLAPGDEIRLEDLPQRIAWAGGSLPAPSGDQVAWKPGDLPERLLATPLREARREIVAAFERSYLEGLLRASRGRIGETAARAGINERSLYDLMRRHRLRKADFKH